MTAYAGELIISGQGTVFLDGILPNNFSEYNTATVVWNRMSENVFNPQFIPAPVDPDAPRYLANFDSSGGPKNYPATFITEGGATILPAAYTTPQDITLAIGNETADDVHVMMFSCDRDARIKLYDETPTLLGTVDITGGGGVGSNQPASDYIWLTPGNNASEPTWFTGGSGTIVNMTVQLLEDPGTDNSDFRYSFGSKVEPPPAVDPFIGILAYYRCEETSGNLDDLENTADTTTDLTATSLTYSETGENNNAVAFGSSSTAVNSNYKDINPVVATDGINGLDYTIDFWLRLDSLATGYVYNATSTDGGTGHTRYCRLWYDGSASKWWWQFQGGDGFTPGSATSIQVGGTGVSNGLPTTADGTTWHYVALTIDRSGLTTAYINGVSKGTVDPNFDGGFHITTSQNKQFGGAVQFGLDEVGVWDRLLASNEVEARNAGQYR